MKIMMTVENPTPAFQRDYFALMERHAAAIGPAAPPQWTPELAKAYYAQLPPRARAILHAVVMGHGRIDVDEVRRFTGENLRGCTGAFKRILNEGARQGLWPHGLPVPVLSIHRGGRLTAFDMPCSPDLPYNPNDDIVFKAFEYLVHVPAPQ